MVCVYSARKYLTRVLVLILGVVAMAFGIAFSIQSKLGTTPISSAPYVASAITGMTVGTTTIIVNSLFVALQVLILRRDFRPIQTLQLAVAFFLGLGIDFALYCISGLPDGSYAVRWLYCVAGILLLGIGVSLEVAADLVVAAGEGFVLAVCKKTPVKFGDMKAIFDLSLVALSVLAATLFLGKPVGVREGTLASALLVGQVAKLILARRARLAVRQPSEA